MNAVEPASLYSLLESASSKPRPFSVYTASELWTDEHTSAQMLAFHLDGEIDVSSRRTDFIDGSVRWMTDHFGLTGDSRIIDFGCGPGLYTSRFACLGATVFGVDFSSRSIEYAKAHALREDLAVTYVEADYLDFQPARSFDLVTMIMCDFCALSPAQRGTMLAKFGELLSEHGRIVLDVYSMQSFADKQEGVTCEKNQLNGFWSPHPYFGLVASFRYDDEKVGLDKYTIVEETRLREIYNWLQYFSPESLEREVHDAGLRVDELYGDVSGSPYDPEGAEFAVVMTKP
ncbi:MAG: class I SAM-dependent methyltransferase [Woeseiaceae bacterium]|jgi:cyclopropane fatty-acyl-phospholipid synthase-like methyltransferase